MQNLEVVQFEGLAPSVFCGMYFADGGAKVTIISRPQSAPFSMPTHNNLMNRYKKCVCLSVKDPLSNQAILRILSTADVIIDPFRPGILQKLKLGPEQVWKINPKAIFLRVTGYGQSSTNSLRPGHDLNYLSVSGVLPLLNNLKQQLQFPTNFYADFMSTSLGVLGVLLALIERQKTNKGQVVDFSITDGCKYYAKFLNKTQNVKPNYQFITRGNDSICISKKSQQAKICLDKLNGQNPYLKDNQIQASIVMKVPKFNEDILISPFHKQSRALKIPKKGEDNHAQLLRRGFSRQVIDKITPKL